MKYVIQAPSPPLSTFVEHFWFLSDAPLHAREWVVPSGTLELVVNLQEDAFRVYGRGPEPCRRLAGTMVSGAYGTAFGIDTAEHAAILGVHFRPGGAAPFLGVPPGALADQHAPLDALWGPEAARLRERLLEAGAPQQRFRLLEEALLARLLRSRTPHRAIAPAVAQLRRPGATVAGLASQLGLSHRRLVEVFTASVGLSPKRFQRVARFQRALALSSRADAPAWAELALECGYADQSHLIREFVALCGFSPHPLTRLRSVQVKEHHLAAL